MSNYLFVTKNVVTKSVPRKKKTYENDKGKSSRKFYVEKIENKKINDILEIKDDNENQKIDLNNENYTIELSGDEENRLNNEIDNDITTFVDTSKQKYPLFYNNINFDNNLNKINMNKEQIQLIEKNEKKIDGQLEKILQKGKEKINQYMNAKFQRLNDIMLKEEAIKLKRLREDETIKLKRLREDETVKLKRLREDIEIEKEKEIIRFEEEIKLMNLRNQLRYISGDSEGFAKREEIISLMEETERENQDNANDKQKKNSKKRKIPTQKMPNEEERKYKRLSFSNE